MDNNKKSKLQKLVDVFRKNKENENSNDVKTSRRVGRGGSKVVEKRTSVDPETGQTTKTKEKIVSYQGKEGSFTKEKKKTKIFDKEGKKTYQGRERMDTLKDPDYMSMRTTQRESMPGGNVNKKYSFSEKQKYASENLGTRKNPEMSPEYTESRLSSRTVSKKPTGKTVTTEKMESGGMDYDLKSEKWYNKKPVNEKQTSYRFRKNKS